MNKNVHNRDTRQSNLLHSPLENYRFVEELSVILGFKFGMPFVTAGFE